MPVAGFRLRSRLTSSRDSSSLRSKSYEGTEAELELEPEQHVFFTPEPEIAIIIAKAPERLRSHTYIHRKSIEQFGL